jgi:hypothetical protein
MEYHDNGRLRDAATRGLPAAYNNWRLEHPLETRSLGYRLMLQRVLAGEAVVHEPDLMAGEAYRQGHPGRRATGPRGFNVRVRFNHPFTCHILPLSTPTGGLGREGLVQGVTGWLAAVGAWARR